MALDHGELVLCVCPFHVRHSFVGVVKSGKFYPFGLVVLLDEQRLFWIVAQPGLQLRALVSRGGEQRVRTVWAVLSRTAFPPIHSNDDALSGFEFLANSLTHPIPDHITSLGAYNTLSQQKAHFARAWTAFNHRDKRPTPE